MTDLSTIARTLEKIAEADGAIDWPGILMTGLVTFIATAITAAVSILVFRREIHDRRREWLNGAVSRCMDSIERFVLAIMHEEDEAWVTMRGIFVRSELQALSANRSPHIEQALKNIIMIWERTNRAETLKQKLDGATRVSTLLGNLALAKDLPGLVSASERGVIVPLGESLSTWPE